MKKVKRTLKRVLAMLCALLTLPGIALASQASVGAAVPLGSIKDTASALQAVNAQAAAMIAQGALTNAGEARYLSLYAEGALSQSGAERVEGKALTLNADYINRVARNLDPGEFQEILNKRMTEQGIELFGGVGTVAEFQMVSSEISVTIEPDVASVTSVDGVLIKTPFYDLSFRPVDLADDLYEPLWINLKDVSETLEPRIEVRIPSDPEDLESAKDITGHFTLSLPSTSGNLPELAMVKEITPEEKEVIVSSYNNVTQQMDGLVSVPGVYATPSNGKSFEHDFSDADKLKGFQLTAAKFVYGKGIMDGYTDDRGNRTFRPAASVTRGQFVKIMMYAIGHKNTKRAAQYPDVKSGTYYYYPAGIAQQKKYMEGYDDGLFHPQDILNRAQICAIMGRILKARKNYRTPSNPEALIRRHYDD
ncbi:MAG: S-layer homology domain-containing protein, partial [Oscillibacter sp.]|nr:S-layer homology domain-containing protein [Oscillibacter sp.]